MADTTSKPASRATRRLMRLAASAAMCSSIVATVACSHGSAPASAGSWDPRAAAAYLDRRMEWWIGWKNSARDHGTFCFSCHTAVPYALARPALRTILAESADAAPERKLMDDVRRRVRLWDETTPFYSDQYVAPGKSAESRGTEAVLSALMLASDDARTGRLSEDTTRAFDHMWAEQHTNGASAGAWSWLDFDLSPWESGDAAYYGAALAALAIGLAPENYRSRPQIQDHLRLLRDYLARNYPHQSLHHRLILSWASVSLPGVLDAEQRQALVAEALRAQNPDGGWSLSALLPKSDGGKTLLSHPDSDGYATGLVVLVLEQTAMAAAAGHLQHGLTWLMRNQIGHGGSWIRGQEGFWVAHSLNKWRSPWSNVGRFMSDAATAYAVLALSEPAQAQPSVAAVRR